MEKTSAGVAGVFMDVYRLDTLVVGSGAAGLNAADLLCAFGIGDVAILTEGMRMGTSRNAGSDKQTYYKLGLAGDRPDSVRAMADTLFSGGAMHGDIALVQAALSPVCFARLVDIGVPFPHNLYGEYVGYRTDHDDSTRATSAGPLTSQAMADRLERQVRARGIPIFDTMQAVALVTTDGDEGSAAPETRRVCGLLALDTADRLGPKFVLFHCARVVYATGGPAGLYADSVYPPSQTGATGIALEAGAPGQNLTEWQYGIASTRFRWNLSGTYQQVLPRYLSTAPDGSDAHEFLREYFDSDAAMLSAVFLKGYQWPFDPRKLDSGGSSIVDIAVHRERCERGRRVFLDYRSNPQGVVVPLAPGQPAGEAYEYLARSGALDGMPIDRLRIMNPDAIRLYASHGIDLANEPLEIAVCAQHNNGGLTGDIWWESPLRGLYPVGEANGSFGVYRPGGSALNETQAGSRRAAQRIAREGPGQGVDVEAFFAACLPVVRHRLALTGRMLEPENDSPAGDAGLRLPPGPFRRRLQRRMSDAAGFLRDPRLMRTALAACLAELAEPAAGQRAAGPGQLAFALRNYDLLIAQAAYLGAMLDAAEHGTGSRGSCLVIEEQGDHACAGLRFRLSPEGMDKTLQVCEMRRVDAKGVDPPEFLFSSVWTPVRPIPPDDQWFENDWSMYRSHWRVSTKEEESC